MRWSFTLLVLFSLVANANLRGGAPDDVPVSVRVVLENTEPLQHSRGDRLPLFVLPISGSLAGCDDQQAEQALSELDRRGIGYTVDWQPGRFEESVTEGLRIARLQQQLGQPVGGLKPSR